MSTNPQKLFRPAALERLASPEQLDRLVLVADGQAWIMLATLAAMLVVALGWSVFARIPSQIAAPGVLVESTAIVLVATDRGPLVRPGMPVRVASTAFPKEAYGSLTGRVTEVSSEPQSAAHVLTAIPNPELARRLGGERAPYVVRVSLDPASPRGFPHSGNATQTITATIDYRTQAPIGLVIPAFAHAESTAK